MKVYDKITAVKVGDKVTCVVATGLGQTTMHGVVEHLVGWTNPDAVFIRFVDRTHLVLHEAELLLGINWLHGHHAPDSIESKALLVACSLL